MYLTLFNVNPGTKVPQSLFRLVLAEMPGVAWDSIRNEGTREINYGSCILASRPDRFTPDERAPGIHWIGGWVGPTIGLDVGEKRNISPPAGNRTRAVQPVARQDATDIGMIMMECTPPHIDFSLEFCL
jgi:hypothetical protein